MHEDLATIFYVLFVPLHEHSHSCWEAALSVIFYTEEHFAEPFGFASGCSLEVIGYLAKQRVANHMP
jgi:hypothetical protein